MIERWFRHVVLALTAASLLLVALDLRGPVRTVVLVAFVLMCPGTAWARALRWGDGAEVLGAGLAISAALAATIGQAMALASWWSPGTAFLALVSITVAGCHLDARHDLRRAVAARETEEEPEELDADVA